MENTPHLETPRLLLRRAVPEDAQAMWELLRQTETNTFFRGFRPKAWRMPKSTCRSSSWTGTRTRWAGITLSAEKRSQSAPSAICM